MIVLIPSYEPDERLVALVDRLRGQQPHLDIVVVDDGSGPRYAPVFAAVAARGCVVLRHPNNRGKGAALRTGLGYALDLGTDVVCADSDGQHQVPDILRVARTVAENPGAVVLGVRQFTGVVPLRSRFGNSATRRLFHLATGLDVTDTQTGLRGYGRGLVPWLLRVPGERFAWEMSALVEAHRAGLPVVQVPIATVYHDGNRGSHFRPLADSAAVYGPLLRFTASSLGAFALDLAMLLLLMAGTGSLLFSVVGARLVSSAANFAVNRSLVFGSPRPARLLPAAVRYYTLATALLVANLALMWSLTVALGAALLPAKIATELALFVVSFVVQRTQVFRVRGDVADDPAAAALSGARIG